MMQETGNKIGNAIQSLSILIDRDGLSFYDGISNTSWSYPLQEDMGNEGILGLLSDVSVDTQYYDRILVVQNTSRFTMVPSELFDSSRGGDYLKSAGISYHSERDVFVVSHFGDIVFLWVLEACVVDFLTDKFQNKVLFMHPLTGALSFRQHYLSEGQDDLFLQLFSNTLAVTYYRGTQLFLAEYYPVASVSDVGFYLSRIIADYEVRSSRVITIAGFVTEGIKNCLYRCFPEVKFMQGIGYLNVFHGPDAAMPSK